MTPLIIGNCISFAAACFTLASALSGDRFSVSGVTTFLLCAGRNLLLARDRFTRKLCIVFVAAVAVIGLAANNRRHL